MGQIGCQEPGSEPKAQETLHAFDADHGALQMQPGAGPLDEQTLVFAVHGAFGPVGAHGRQPQQRVERDTAQRPRMGPDAQIPLREEGLHGQQQRWHAEHGQHHQEGLGGSEPHQASGRAHQFGDHTDALAPQLWEQP